MNARTGPSATAAFFILISSACLGVACWLVRSELFPDAGSQVPTAEHSSSARAEMAKSEDLGPRDISHRAEPAPDPAIGITIPPAAAAETSRSAEVDHTPAAPLSLTDIQVVYKIDLQRRGRRTATWAMLPTFTRVQSAGQVTVEAQARGTGTNGEKVLIDPIWIPADPDMIQVGKPQKAGISVMITVLRAGLSNLRVSWNGFSKELTVNAVHENEGMRVEISQQ